MTTPRIRYGKAAAGCGGGRRISASPLLNQGLLFVVVALTFFLARKLFDLSVAWLSVGLLVGMELIVALRRVRIVHDAFDGDRAGIGVVHGLSGAGGPGAEMGAAGVAAAAGHCGAVDRRRGDDPVQPGLPDHPGAVVLVSGCDGERQVAMCLILAATFAVVCAPWIIETSASAERRSARRATRSSMALPGS